MVLGLMWQSYFKAYLGEQFKPVWAGIRKHNVSNPYVKFVTEASFLKTWILLDLTLNSPIK